MAGLTHLGIACMQFVEAEKRCAVEMRFKGGMVSAGVASTDHVILYACVRCILKEWLRGMGVESNTVDTLQDISSIDSLEFIWLECA